MRQLSVHRPDAKVRNPKRHLKALRCWAESLEGLYPEENSCGYEHWKIPVLDRLVQGPTSHPEWQCEAIASLVVAAEKLIAAKPAELQGKSWVAVLLCYPNLWESEVIVFFSEDYYERFNYKKNLITKQRISEKLKLTLPANFVEVGSHISYEEEPDEFDDEVYRYESQHWFLAEPRTQPTTLATAVTP